MSEIREFSTPPAAEYSIRIPDTDKPRVVLIGGGFGGAQFVKSLNDRDFQLVMFDRHNYHTFQPLLYQVATAGLEPDSIAAPLRKIFDNKKNFYFRMALVNKIVPEQNCVQTSIGNIRYDVLVISTGSRTNYFGNDELIKKCFPLKQVPQALDMRSQILQNMEKAVLTNDLRIQEGLLNYVVVGGGPTGVELAGSIAELKRHIFPKDYPELDLKRMNIFLVEGGNKVLGAMSEKSSKWALKYLQEMGVTVVLNSVVQSYDGETVYLKNGSTIRTKTLIWAAGVKGNVVPGLKEECLFKGNRILVDRFNRASCYPNIYALGDVAAMIDEEHKQGYPMLAPVAKQQGETLARNLNAQGRGREMKPFKYNDRGSMATIGRNKAVAELPGGIFLRGFLAWAAWMLVHVLFLIGFRSKLIVMANWIWSYITFDKGTRLIIRPYVKPNNPAEEEPLPKEVAAHTPGAEKAAASSAR